MESLRMRINGLAEKADKIWNRLIESKKKEQILIFIEDNKESDKSASYLEDKCLSECNIKYLLEKVNELAAKNGQVHIVGDRIANFVEPGEGLSSAVHLNETEDKKYESLFLFNISEIYHFLKKRPLIENIMKIKGELVFIMPYTTNHPIQVIWDEGFSDVEGADGGYFRWYTGEDHIGHVYIYNNTDCYKPVRIQFDMYTANPNAKIVLKSGSYSQIFDMANEEHEFNMEMILVPEGKNELEFIFCGEVCNLSETEQRKCQFTVTNLSVTELEDEKIVYTGKEVYNRQYDADLIKYILSDRYIRKNLHASGCFEIETYKCNQTGIYPTNVTRSYVSYDEYYTLYSENEEDRDENGLVLYIAKRKGKYYEQ